VHVTGELLQKKKSEKMFAAYPTEQIKVLQGAFPPQQKSQTFDFLLHATGLVTLLKERS